MRGGGRSDGAGLRWSGAIRWPGVRRRRASIAAESRRDPRSRVNSPRLRAAELCSVCVMVVKPPVPLVGPRERQRGCNPRAFNRVETRPPGRWGNAHRSTARTPQSKPVTPASRLVAREAPLVGAGLGLRILAAGPAHVRLYSYSGRLCEPGPQKFARLIRARGHRLIHRRRTARLPRSAPAPESLTEAATPHLTEHWISAHWLLSPHPPRCWARTTRPAQSPFAAERRGATKHQVDERTQPLVAHVARGPTGYREA